MRTEIEPVVDELGNPRGCGASRLLIGRNDQIGKHLHGPPLMVVEHLTLVCLLDRRGRLGVRVLGLRLRSRGGGRNAQNMDQVAAGDVHV